MGGQCIKHLEEPSSIALHLDVDPSRRDMVLWAVLDKLRDNNSYMKKRVEVPRNPQTTGYTASYHQDEDHKDHFIAHPQLIYFYPLPPILYYPFLYSRSCINMLG